MTIRRKVKKDDAEVEKLEMHKGGLFFPMPNGTALVGTANKPDVEGTITATVRAKKTKSIIIPVKNWPRGSTRIGSLPARPTHPSSFSEPTPSMSVAIFE
jgi:hypothetical protein